MEAMSEDDMALMAGLAELQSDPKSIIARTGIPLGESSMIAQAIPYFGSTTGRSAENPSAGALGTVNSLAKFYGALAQAGITDGVRLLADDSVKAFRTEQSRRASAAFPEDLHFTMPNGAEVRSPIERWGLGYQLNIEATPVIPLSFGRSDSAFGHSGMGGQYGMADPDTGLGLGFVRSHASMNFRDAEGLRDRLYSCLAEES